MHFFVSKTAMIVIYYNLQYHITSYFLFLCSKLEKKFWYKIIGISFHMLSHFFWSDNCWSESIIPQTYTYKYLGSQFNVLVSSEGSTGVYLGKHFYYFKSTLKYHRFLSDSLSTKWKGDLRSKKMLKSYGLKLWLKAWS